MTVLSPAIFWQLPLASAAVGYGLGALLPSLILKRYYSPLEAKAFHLLSEQCLTTLPENYLKEWVKHLTPTQIEHWLLARLEQLQEGIRSQGNIRKLYRLGDEYIPLACDYLARHYLSNLEGANREKIANWMSDLYDRLFPQIQLQYHQAEVMMDVVFGIFLTPSALRQMLMEGLMPLPTEVIEKTLKQQLSGMPGMLFRFVDLKPAINRFKLMVVEDPQMVSHTITQLIDQFELREKLAERLSRTRWEAFSENDRDNIRQWLNRFIDEWLQDDPDTLCELLVSFSSGSSRLLIRGILQTDWKNLLTLSHSNQPLNSEPDNHPGNLLSALSNYLYQLLVDAGTVPPIWLKRVTASIQRLGKQLLIWYPAERRQALILQLVAPIQQRVALVSAGVGAGYGLFNAILLTVL